MRAPSTSDEAQARWALAFVDALEAAGVERAYVSPGSRSTPLVWALGESAIVRTVVIDERAAAFAALGAALATDTPSLLVCTSGSAGAHYYPAIVEAHQAGVPLVVCTADRPPELQANGSSQTIDQTRLFGAFARAFSLGTASAVQAHIYGAMRVAQQAVQHARAERTPVHINLPFRKPLEPPLHFDVEAARAARRAPRELSKGTPERLSSRFASRLLAAFASAERPVVVAGPLPARLHSARDAATRLAAALGAPLWAERSSQLDGDSGFEAYLRRPRALLPDAILQLGPTPVSAHYDRLLAAQPPAPYCVVSDVGAPDARNCATEVVRVSDLARALDRLADAAEEGAGAPLSSQVAERRARWRGACEEAHTARISELASWLADAPFSGIAAARTLAERVPPRSTLLVGNSLSIRDLDEASPRLADDVTIQSHRGSAGIDGWFASTLGAAWATRRPTLALLGDVAAAHDLSSLAMSHDAPAPVVLCVLDNEGGRIFERLPVAAHPALVDRLRVEWLTPPGIDFVAVARALGLRASAVQSTAALASAIDTALQSPGVTLIHALVDPSQDAIARDRLHASQRAALGAISQRMPTLQPSDSGPHEPVE